MSVDPIVPGVADSARTNSPAARLSISALGTAARLPLVLCLDTSNSLAKSNLVVELRTAVARSFADLARYAELRAAVEVAVVTFGLGGVRLVAPCAGAPEPANPAEAFINVDALVPPPLDAGGSTPLAAAAERALGAATARTAWLEQQGLDAVVPNIWFLTDGVPTDEDGYPSDAWRSCLPTIRAAEARRDALVFAAGLRGADAGVLGALAPSSHFMASNVNVADALAVVSLSSRESLAGGSADDVYTRVRELLGVDAGGELL